MHDLPAHEEEFFSSGAWVVAVLTLIALFGAIVLVAIMPVS